MRSFSNEIKVGIFVLLSLAVGAYLFMQTQNISPGETYKVKTDFNFAGSLKENAIVMLSGIAVGRVESTRFRYNNGTKVEVTLSIEKRAKVRKDSLAYIGTMGFVGDAFVGLTPGSPDSPFVKGGDRIASEDPIDMREIMKRVEVISGNLDKALISVRSLATNLDGTIKDNRSKIDSIIINLEKTAVNFNDFSEDIRKHPWKLLMKGKDKDKKKKKKRNKKRK